MKFRSFDKRFLRQWGLLAGSTVLLAASGHAQTATNFGSVNVCPAGLTGQACLKVENLPTVSLPVNAILQQPSVTVLTEGAPNLDFQLARESCSFTTCTFAVSFRPQYPGLRRGMVEVATQANDVLAKIPIYGVGVGPQLGFGLAQQSTIVSGSVLPTAMAVDGAGTLYFADDSVHQVLKQNGRGTPATIASGYSVSALALDGGGNLYIGDSTNARLLVRTTAGSTTVLADDILAAGIAVDGAGHVFVADNRHNQIIKIANGTTSVVTITPGAYGLAVDGVSDLFFTESTGILYRLSSNFIASPLATGIASIPGTLAIDAGGNVYAPTSKTLLQVASSEVQTPASGGIPNGAAVDASGNLFYGDPSLNRIMKVNRVPTLLRIAATGTLASFAIENTGNAVMTDIQAGWVGIVGELGIGCQTLQPGQSCPLQLATSTGGGGTVEILYSNGSGQTFKTQIGVAAQQVVPASLSGGLFVRDGTSVVAAADVNAPEATGTVTISIGNNSCTVPLSNGSATCQVALKQKPTVYYYKISYSGDATTEQATYEGQSCSSWNLNYHDCSSQ